MMTATEMIAKIHGLIPMDRLCPFTFLTLVCTGHTTGWVASFDDIWEVEWYEFPEKYPFSACAASPDEAIILAGEKVLAMLERQVES